MTFEIGSTIAVCLTIALATFGLIWRIAAWKTSNDSTLQEIKNALQSHQDEMKELWNKKEADHSRIFDRLAKLDADVKRLQDEADEKPKGRRA